MDGDSGTPSPVKAKKRKGRPPKVKTSEPLNQDQGGQSSLLMGTKDSTTSQLSSVEAATSNIYTETTNNSTTKTEVTDNKNNSSNDNLLMPPPPALTQIQEMAADTSTEKEECEAIKENEMCIDGFSICCYESEDTVDIALKATGRAYENKRLTINKDAISASKSPRLPLRSENRSPTGRGSTAGRASSTRSPTGRGRGSGRGRGGRPGRPSKRPVVESPLVRENKSCPDFTSMDVSNSPAVTPELSVSTATTTVDTGCTLQTTTATTTICNSAPGSTADLRSMNVTPTSTATSSGDNKPCIPVLSPSVPGPAEEQKIKVTPIAPKPEVIVKTIFDLEFNARNNAMKTEPQTPILPGKKRGRKSLGKEKKKGETNKKKDSSNPSLTSPAPVKPERKKSVKSEAKDCKPVKSENKIKCESKPEVVSQISQVATDPVNHLTFSSSVTAAPCQLPSQLLTQPALTDLVKKSEPTAQSVDIKSSEQIKPTVPNLATNQKPIDTPSNKGLHDTGSRSSAPPPVESITCGGNTGSRDFVNTLSAPTSTVAAADLSSPSTLTTTSVTVSGIATVTASVTTTRSNSVPSVSSSQSRQATPVCATSSTRTPSRENNGSSRATSRNSSDRNPSRSSQQPATSSAETFNPFSSTQYGPLNPAMLSFGAPNGLTAPFNFPGAASGLGQSPGGFPFSADPFSHHAAASMAVANQEAMRAELSRRMLMDASERQLPPFLRPESMMFPPGAAGAASMGSNPLASNMPGSAMLLQQMFDKIPKMDPLQMLLHQRNAAAVAAVTSASGAMPNPLIGHSPFQSAVPGGSQTGAGESVGEQKKKTGKWCAAHVRVAYMIHNAHQTQKATEEASKNGNLPATNSKEKKSTAAYSSAATQLTPTLSHSISAITSNVHKPKDVPASVTHPRPTPKPSTAPSPNTVGRLSADSRKSAASSPSQHHQSEQQQSQRQRPSSAASHPGSPASFHSSHSHHSTKDAPASLSRGMPNGNLPSQSPKESSQNSSSRWGGNGKPQHHPSVSSSSSEQAPSPLNRKRDRDERDRRSNGSYSSPNSQNSRPSPSTHTANKKRRSRSGSPLERSIHNSSKNSPHPYNNSNTHLNNSTNSNNKSMDAMRMLHANSLAAAAATSGASNSELHQLFSSMYGQAMMGENKAMPSSNGFGSAPSAQGAHWNPFAMAGLQDMAQQQQQQQDRERLSLMQMNPALAMAFAEQQRNSVLQNMLELERAKHVAQGALHNNSLSGLNGFHHPNPLSSLSSLGSGPPPLIPTSQAKMTLPNLSHHMAASTHGSSNSAGENSR